MTASSTRIKIIDRQHRVADPRPPMAGPDGPRLPEDVEALLRLLPSHGWTAGWTGRRDRALVVLAYQAGLSFAQIAALTAGDLTILDGTAIVRTHGGRTTLSRNDDSLLCGPCGLARWVHALDLTVVYPDGRVIAALIARAMPLVSSSPHLCESNNTITEITRGLALVPPIDRWGHPVRLPMQPAPDRTRRGRSEPGGQHRMTVRPVRPLETTALWSVPRSISNSDAVNRAQLLRERVDQLLAGSWSPATESASAP